MAKANLSPSIGWGLILCVTTIVTIHTISCAEGARSARTLTTVSSASLPPCIFFLSPDNKTIPSISLDGPPDTGVGPYVMDSVSGEIVQVGSSGKASFICPDKAGNSTGDQFYVSGQQAQIKFRTFNSEPQSYFRNSCFVIPLTAVQIPAGSSVLNLNLGDQNQLAYPDEHRCLIFATGPSTAPCSCLNVEDDAGLKARTPQTTPGID